MQSSGVFFFGVKIFQLPNCDRISSLPLELSWKIFLYLDETSLRNASRAHKKWYRIIVAHKKLRSRLNFFELSLQTGSEALARFIVKQRNMRTMRKMKKTRTNNYLSIEEYKVETPKRKTTTGGLLLSKSNKNNVKRGGDDIKNCTKRRRIF